MSLQVWLPLNGDLRNLGCSNLQFINSNSSTIIINNEGKIGNCYCRPNIKTAGDISSDATVLLDKDLSICCWAKVTGTVGNTANGLVSNHSTANKSGFGINVKQISTDDYRICCSTGNGSSRTYYTYYGTTNIKNEWHHLALTYDNTKKEFQLWVDGKSELTQSYTNHAIATKISIFNWDVTGTNNNYKPACSLNDVRIYDHCLSPLEVKEISQGLIAHWTFTKESIMDGRVSDASGYGNYLNIIGGTTDTNTARYSTSTNFTNEQYAISPRQSGDWLPKEQMTVNLWTKWTTWGNPISCTQGGGWNFEYGGTTYGIQFPVYLTNIGGYKIARSAIDHTSLTNGWHMFTGVFDGTSVKIYIDGVERTNATVTFSLDTIKYANNTPLVISGEAKANLNEPQSTDQVGNISDVRIYCTPLLDNDIKLLYNNSMRIDNLNNIHAVEFIEQEAQNISDSMTVNYSINGGTIENTTLTIGLGPQNTDPVTIPAIFRTYNQINLQNLSEYSLRFPPMTVKPVVVKNKYSVNKYVCYYQFVFNIYNSTNELIKNYTNARRVIYNSSQDLIEQYTTRVDFKIPEDVPEAAYGQFTMTYIYNDLATIDANNNSVLTISSVSTIKCAPIKITRQGQFYNHIINSNSWINQKVSFVRDGQIIAKDFIEM